MKYYRGPFYQSPFVKFLTMTPKRTFPWGVQGGPDYRTWAVKTQPPTPLFKKELTIKKKSPLRGDASRSFGKRWYKVQASSSDHRFEAEEKRIEGGKPVQNDVEKKGKEENNKSTSDSPCAGGAEATMIYSANLTLEVQNQNDTLILNILNFLTDRHQYQNTEKWSVIVFELLGLYVKLLNAHESQTLTAELPEEYQVCVTKRINYFNRPCAILFYIFRDREFITSNTFLYKLISALIFWTFFINNIQNILQNNHPNLHHYYPPITAYTLIFVQKIQKNANVINGNGMKFGFICATLLKTPDQNFVEQIVLPEQLSFWLEHFDIELLQDFDMQKKLTHSKNLKILRYIDDSIQQIEQKNQNPSFGLKPKTSEESQNQNQAQNTISVANKKWVDCLGNPNNLTVIVKITKDCKNFIENAKTSEALLCEYLFYPQPFLSTTSYVSILQHNLKILFPQAKTFYSAYREFTFNISAGLSEGSVDLLLFMDLSKQLWAVVVELKIESKCPSKISSWCGQVASYGANFERWLKDPQNRQKLNEDLSVPEEGDIKVSCLLLLPSEIFQKTTNNQFETLSEDLTRIYSTIPLAVATFSYVECELEAINFPSYFKPKLPSSKSAS